MYNRLLPALCACLLFGALTGCGLNASSPSASTNTQSGQDRQAVQGTAADSPQKTYNAVQSGDIPVTSAIADNETDAKMESTKNPDQAASGANSASNTEAKWDPNHPKLRGISLQDTKVKLDQLLGDPSDLYTLQDEQETVTVQEYDGFAVGLDDTDSVNYVEVFDNSVAPGLGGLRVGDPADDAIKALGTPGSRTTNVLTYPAGGAMLKLDLDPEADTILSIKMFLNSTAS